MSFLYWKDTRVKEDSELKKLIYKLQNKFMRTCGNDISYLTMKKMIDDNSNIVVVDVRTKDEFRYNKLKGAINIPLQDISEDRVKKYIKNKNTLIIVYCEYGGRSKKALVKFKRMGYENVYNLEGGISAI